MTSGPDAAPETARRSQFMDGNPSYKRATSIRNKGFLTVYVYNFKYHRVVNEPPFNLPTSWPYLFGGFLAIFSGGGSRHISP